MRPVMVYEMCRIAQPPQSALDIQSPAAVPNRVGEAEQPSFNPLWR